MEGNDLKLLIVAFVSLIVGISLLIVISGENVKVRETIDISNETIDLSSYRNLSGNWSCNESVPVTTIANPPTTWRLENEYGCWISDINMGNHNGTDWTNGTDYVFYERNGTWRCLNSELFNHTETNLTVINYTYCPDTYLTQSWARVMVGIVPGFFAIALIAMAIGMFYVILKREGLMNI